MKIDLTKVKVQPSLLEEEKELDVHKIVADLIWKECANRDIAQADFAMRLFKSDGEIEITEEEKAYILSITDLMKFWLAQGIKIALGMIK